MRNKRGSIKEIIRGTLNLNQRRSLIHQMKPQDLRRTNIIGLTNASAPTVRKETIQINGV